MDPLLLWLWCRPAAIAPIRPLAWKPPYAADVAIIKIYMFLEFKWRNPGIFVVLLCSMEGQIVSSFVVVVFVFLGPYLWHMEVPRPGVELEL